MKFEVYNKNESNMKIAFFAKKTFGNIFEKDINLEAIAKFNNLEIHLLDVDFLDSGDSIRKSYKEHLSLESKKNMQELYAYIIEYIVNNDIHVSMFFGSGYPWSSHFLEKLKRYSYVACYFVDDPEGSKNTSMLYVKYYHYAFCGGIFFDKHTRIVDKYLEWGAIKSKYIPLGACPSKYSSNPPEYLNRDIDIIFVGGAYLKKIIRMFKLKKHFGDRMLLYGRSWNYHGNNIFKTIIVRIVKGYYNIPEIEELPKDKLVDLYRRTKIGFNVHQSYGPSNQRTFELPANGVMQICDCKVGLKELYKLNEEVVNSDSVEDTIKKIEFYLKHDEERMRIAKNGYAKVINNYRLEQSFKIMLDEIKKDIHTNKILMCYSS